VRLNVFYFFNKNTNERFYNPEVLIYLLNSGSLNDIYTFYLSKQTKSHSQKNITAPTECGFSSWYNLKSEKS